MARSSSFTSQFNEPAFRSAVVGAMLMGMPEDTSEQLTWVWDRRRTYVPDDPAGSPYDWTVDPATDSAGNPNLPDSTTPAPQRLVVPYALEFAIGPSATTTLGEINTARATVTVLDDAHAQIETADYAQLGDTRYR